MSSLNYPKILLLQLRVGRVFFKILDELWTPLKPKLGV
jgi:hypothetical protein